MDDLFANIDIDGFIADYNNGLSNLQLKRKCNIFSNKSVDRTIEFERVIETINKEESITIPIKIIT